MINFKKQVKNIFGLFSISILLAVLGIGFLIKEKNNSKPVVVDPEKQNFEINNNPVLNQIPEVNSQRPVCNSMLEENENSVTLREYNNINKVDCFFVGCGGIF